MVLDKTLWKKASRSRVPEVFQQKSLSLFATFTDFMNSYFTNKNYIYNLILWHKKLEGKNPCFQTNILNFLTHFSSLLYFILKPVIWFWEQIKWLVSIWNATLGWNWLKSILLLMPQNQDILLIINKLSKVLHSID